MAETRVDSKAAVPSQSHVDSSAAAAKKLSLLFVGWKLALLTAVFCTPDLVGSSGYDTSGDLWWSSNEFSSEYGLWQFMKRLLLKLTRWDAIYFANIAKHGYTFEQEWAFGWGWTRLIGECATRGMIFGDGVYPKGCADFE
jgi:GPI mannosyltransferase 2